MTPEQMREIFLSNGFTVKDGHTDLKPYVYAAGEAIAAAARAEAIEECANRIYPKNSVEDWTEYAQARADAAADLHAMLNTGEKT